MPWSSDYEPKRYDGIVGNDDVVYEIKTLMTKQTIPNILLYGPEGVGKTVLVKCMFGGREKCDYMYYDSVADHSLRNVRDNIKMFAKCRATGDAFKLVVIDNADQLYPDAQAFLRRVMEIYVKTTRFVFVMRDMHRLTEPIQSRCMVLHMAAASVAEIVQHLQHVIKAEGVDVSRESLVAIARQAGGSFRRALTLAEVGMLALQQHESTLPDGARWTLPGGLGVPASMAETMRSLATCSSWSQVHDFMQREVFARGFDPAQFLDSVMAERAWSTDVYAALARAVSDIRVGRHAPSCTIQALMTAQKYMATT